ncbi:MAG: glutamine synthetase [Actinobacteria bacterium]|nr:glutamine synthetase [Actinomycetota bacterium]MBM3816717.1 glutamine synthetase [Actinomycetota bacterium]
MAAQSSSDGVRVVKQPSRADLAQAIERGDIDTVVMAFPDLQGRLVGKRTTGRFFLEQVAEHGTENCDYLIATDFDDVAVPGYKFASYDLGYGDMLARADFGTIRYTPWVPKTALILCDLYSVKTGEPIRVAPRQILRDQVAAAQRMHLEPMIGSEIEFYLFRDSYEQIHARGYDGLTPHSPFMEDYQIVQTTRDEYVVGEIRRGLEAAGIPVEFSKGEAGRGQHELNLAYTRALEMADRNIVYKTAAKEIAGALGRSVTFMAKYDFAETGSSCHVHSSLWHLSEGAVRGSAFDGDTRSGAQADAHAPAFTDHFLMYLAGQLVAARDFSILWGPTVNSYKRFQPGSWAPTAVAWGVDNRTLGYRVVGHGASTRVECRIPGADANSYLAFAGTIAAGLYGIRHKLQLPEPYAGNGYEASDLPRIPSTLAEAADLWQHSEIARECFGDDVHHHLLNMARHEWSTFNQTVTDWERVRYFDRA